MRLSEKYRRLVKSLHTRGPLLLEEALERIPRASLYDLVRRRYLEIVPTALGRVVIPGPRGREEVLSLSPHYRPRPQSLADGVLLRRAIRIAEREGWRFLSRNPRGRIAFLGRGGERMLVIASLTPYSVDSLRGTLGRMGWTGSVRVYHPYPGRFRWMAEKLPLEARPLEDLLPVSGPSGQSTTTKAQREPEPRGPAQRRPSPTPPRDEE